MDITQLKTDPGLEEEGVWRPLGEGAEIKVARMGNKAWRRLYDRLMRPHARQNRRGTLDPAIEDAIVVRCMAETVLLDWRGVREGDREVPYSTDNAKRLLGEVREFREIVADYAMDMEAFRAEDLEDAEGNSPSGSAGSSDGEPSSESPSGPSD